MPVSVTVSRGNPLPLPIAALFTLVGLGMIVFGWRVNVDPGGGGFLDTPSEIILFTVALCLVIPAWLIGVLVWLRLARTRRLARQEHPGELAEPPSTLDPALLSVLVGKGTPRRSAVAGTVLELARRDAIDLEEYGDTTVVRVKPDAVATTRTESLVLDGLREEAGSDAQIAASRVWAHDVSWWRDFARDARARAVAAGLAQPTVGFVGLMALFVITATALSLVLFSRTLVFIGLIVLANGVPHLISRASGFKLSILGLNARAQWAAYARYLHNQGSLRDVGPGGIVMWGPNLVYGAVLGEAPRAARVLTPGAPDDAEDIEYGTRSVVYEV